MRFDVCKEKYRKNGGKQSKKEEMKVRNVHILQLFLVNNIFICWCA